MQDIAPLLNGWQKHDPEATEKLKALTYHHLKVIAETKLREQAHVNSEHALCEGVCNATSLLHNALLEMVPPNQSIQTLKQFNSYMSLFIRNVLVDDIRRLKAEKRGGKQSHTSITRALNVRGNLIELEAFEQALSSLEKQNAHKAQLLSMHYFLGLSKAELAEHFGVTTRTIYRELSAGKAFIRVQIGENLDNIN